MKVIIFGRKLFYEKHYLKSQNLISNLISNAMLNICFIFIFSSMFYVALFFLKLLVILGLQYIAYNIS